MKPRILLAVDRIEKPWAFFNIATQIKREYGDDAEVDIKPYHESDGAGYDVAVAFWWESAARLGAAGKIVTCVYDGYSWNADTSARHRFGAALRRSDLLVVANQRLWEQLAGRLPTFLCEDGVDTSLFRAAPLPGTPLVGWAGNSGGSASVESGAPDVKGLGIIRQACKAMQIGLVTCDLADGYRPHQEMPAFYEGITIYACASEVEGTPNPVLEAMACGRPVITTDVGILRSVIVDGVNGVFASRTVQGFSQAILRVHGGDMAKMGANARRAAEAHDWRFKAKAWRACLDAALSL